jgi:hypothetical protein
VKQQLQLQQQQQQQRRWRQRLLPLLAWSVFARKLQLGMVSALLLLLLPLPLLLLGPAAGLFMHRLFIQVTAAVWVVNQSIPFAGARKSSSRHDSS